MASQLWRRSIAIVEKNQLRRVWHYAGVACDGYYKYYCVEWQTASEHRASDLIINERRWWARRSDEKYPIAERQWDFSAGIRIY